MFNGFPSPLYHKKKKKERSSMVGPPQIGRSHCSLITVTLVTTDYVYNLIFSLNH